MRRLLFLTLLAYVRARIVEQNCDGVIVHNINHEKEVLKDNLNSPYQLVIDYDTNTLFFSYTANDGDEVFKSAYINLKNDEFGIINGIGGGFANAVDKDHHIVYLGGRDGIYIYDFNTRKASLTRITNDNIWQMFYKNGLYYTSYPEEKLHLYKDGHHSDLPLLIRNTRVLLAAVDNNNNIIYSNSSGLFSYDSNKDKVYSMGEYNPNGITADVDGNIYFSTPDSVYYINKNKNIIERLFTAPNVYGVAIENDGNIIYAVDNSIVRLKPTKKTCITNEKKSFDINRL